MSLTDNMKKPLLGQVEKTDAGLRRLELAEESLQICQLNNGNKVITASNGEQRIMFEVGKEDCQHLAGLLLE